MTEPRPVSPAARGDEHCFEDAFARLEAIVHRLEDGQLGLSASLASYEEAIGYLKQCHAALQQAERKIMVLTGVDAEGNPVTEPLDDQALTLEQKQQRRGRRRSANARDTVERTTAVPRQIARRRQSERPLLESFADGVQDRMDRRSRKPCPLWTGAECG